MVELRVVAAVAVVLVVPRAEAAIRVPLQRVHAVPVLPVHRRRRARQQQVVSQKYTQQIFEKHFDARTYFTRCFTCSLQISFNALCKFHYIIVYL